jgi:AbrB family looped-hinge helix DNA binding protein
MLKIAVEGGLDMVKRIREAVCTLSTDSEMGRCRVEAVVSVDDRGQMVLPKELRDKAGIQAGDKLAIIGMERDGKMCCISLIKVDEITEMVKSMLGPVMKEIFQE